MTDPATPGGEPVTDLARAVVQRMTARGLTLAVAESLTGGLVCAALTDVPGSSAVLRGGVVSYATELKASALGVDAGRLARTGPVDGLVAEQMALGAAAWGGADLAVATTGVAGPGPADGHPAGTVFVGLAWRGDGGEAAEGGAGEHRATHRAFHFPGDRAAVRRQSVGAALQEVLRQLDLADPLGSRRPDGPDHRRDAGGAHGDHSTRGRRRPA